MNFLNREIIIFRLAVIAALSIFPCALHAQVNDTAELSPENDELEKDFNYFYTDEYMDVKVDVASLFEEDEMVAGSTVSKITSGKWKKIGARRLHETLNNEMSVMAYPILNGSYALAIRGYSNTQSISNVAVILDGVPMNDIVVGTAFYNVPNWELGTLDSIELIKGPGSAIYGSDAFHGVMSMKSFESDKNYYSVEGAGAYPLYGDANVKVSQGIAGDLIRINAAAGASRQADQDIEYKYDDNGATGTGKRKNKYDSQSGVFKIDYNPLDKLKVRLGSYVNYWSCDDFPGTATKPANLRSKDWSGHNSLFLMGNASAVYSLDNGTSVEVQGYRWDVDNSSEIVINPTGDYSLIVNKDSRSAVNLIIKQPVNSFNLQWLMAYSYTQYKLDCFSIELRDMHDNFIRDVGEQESSGFSRDINSVFGQIKWGAVKDSLYFLIGGRMDSYSDFGNQFTPRGGIIYLPAKSASIKALYGRAFKAPSTSQLYGTLLIIDGEPDLEPETIDIYELVFIYKIKQLKCSLTGFYSSWKNGIVAQPVPDPIAFRYFNNGKNRAAGGEFNLYFSTEPFAADIGFSYVESEAFDVVALDDPSITKDQEYIAFPTYSANAGFYYTIKSYDINFYLNNRLYFDMAEAPQEVHDNPKDLPVYFRMDLNISRAVSDKLEIYLDIRNLLNRKNYIPSLVGAEKGYEEPGISVMLRAGYHL